jgi:hypothetical protein
MVITGHLPPGCRRNLESMPKAFGERYSLVRCKRGLDFPGRIDATRLSDAC